MGSQPANCLWVVLLGAGSSGAADAPTETSGGPYCGIYCVYGALQTFGIDVRFDELADRRYVGVRGSSIDDLRRAVVDHGGDALPVRHMTASSLRAAHCPVILHVRRPGLNMPYSHWVLFLGVEDGQARILDPPNGVETMPFAEVLALWDGTGLVVSSEPISSWRVRAGAWFELGMVAGSCFLIVGLVRRLTDTSNRTLSAVVLFVLLPAGLGLFYHTVLDEGFLRNRSAVAQTVGRHFEPAIPDIDLDTVRAMAARSDVTFIDARFPRAYSAGHLPGAKNLPIYSGLPERSRMLASIPPDGPVVVYCQSAQCSWGKVIASDMVLRGRRDVFVFRGGWNEWESHDTEHAK